MGILHKTPFTRWLQKLFYPCFAITMNCSYKYCNLCPPLVRAEQVSTGYLVSQLHPSHLFVHWVPAKLSHRGYALWTILLPTTSLAYYYWFSNLTSSFPLSRSSTDRNFFPRLLRIPFQNPAHPQLFPKLSRMLEHFFFSQITLHCIFWSDFRLHCIVDIDPFVFLLMYRLRTDFLVRPVPQPFAVPFMSNPGLSFVLSWTS